MTEAEAIIELKHLTNQWANDEDMYSPFMKYEVDQKFINAIYVAKNALEKQIAKKPIIRGLGQRYCSVCKCGGADYMYCARCGQKLDR